MAHSASTFYLTYQLHGAAVIETIDSWVLNVYLDTDSDNNTGYQNSTAIGADYLLQGNTLYQYTGVAGGWGWTTLGLVPYVSNGVNAEIAIDRSTIGNPSLMKLILIGDNASLSEPGNQEDAYPDNIYDENSALRALSYSTGGDAVSPATIPLVAAAMTDEVTVSGAQLRFDNAIQPSAVNRDTPTSTDEPLFTVKTGDGSLGSSTLILLLITFFRRRKKQIQSD